MELKRGGTAVQASGIEVAVCQCNVRTEMSEEKCKGSFRRVNSLKEAQDGSHIEETKMNRCRSMAVRRVDSRRKDLHELWSSLRPEGKR
jgi:hypothetical protein